MRREDGEQHSVIRDRSNPNQGKLEAGRGHLLRPASRGAVESLLSFVALLAFGLSKSMALRLQAGFTGFLAFLRTSIDKD